jgi:hypothetical protein
VEIELKLGQRSPRAEQEGEEELVLCVSVCVCVCATRRRRGSEGGVETDVNMCSNEGKYRWSE